MQRLVDYFDLFQVRELGRDGGQPLVDFLELLLGCQRVDPVRLLIAPEQHMPFENLAVVTGVFARRARLRPVVDVTRAFHRAPLAAILRRHLVPVGAEIQRISRTMCATEEFRFVAGS